MTVKITVPLKDAISMIISFLDSKDEEIMFQSIYLTRHIIRDTSIQNIREALLTYLGGGEAWKVWTYKKRFIELFGEAILGDQP